MDQSIIFPVALRPGDRIAIVSPASIIDPALVDGAVATLSAQGWDAWVAPHARGREGTFSGTLAERLADMREALHDSGTRAILCSRGGYGAVHLLDALDGEIDASDPKWLIGFSDISALHALWHRHGIASVHGSMARHLAQFPVNDSPNSALLDILKGDALPDMSWGADARNRQGIATGTLLGGNLAVLADLINTPFDMIRPDSILFIEDIAEPIYKVERIMYQLRLSGVLERLRGLIVGQFTEYRPDANHSSMEDMIADMVSPYGYPVAFNAPIGHIAENMPVVESATVTLTVNDGGASITYLQLGR